MNKVLSDTLSGLYDIALRLNQKIDACSGNVSGSDGTITDLNIEGLSSLIESLSGLQQQLEQGQGGQQQEEVIEVDDGDIVYSVHPTVIVLSGDTSYELENDKFYRCSISDDTTFELPTVQSNDLTELHEIYLVTFFQTADEVTFINSATNAAVTPLDENEWDPYDVVQYICRYEPYVSGWVIIPSKIAEVAVS